MKDMTIVDNEEAINSTISASFKMGGLVPQLISLNKFFQVKANLGKFFFCDNC